MVILAATLPAKATGERLVAATLRVTSGSGEVATGAGVAAGGRRGGRRGRSGHQRWSPRGRLGGA